MSTRSGIPAAGALLAVLRGHGDHGWRQRAVCARTDPEAFFPSPGTDGAAARMARRVCRGCPVRVACLRFALDHDERDGIWGGLSERQRHRLRRGQPVSWRAGHWVRLDAAGRLVTCQTQRGAA